jgi:serine/threonine-protein kinase
MTDDEPAGPIFDDRYEPQARLDSGGLATVWRGVDRETDVPVAIKCEDDRVHDSEQVRSHFRQELRWFRYLDAGLRAGSLVHFLDGALDVTPGYIVTELLDGPPVDDVFTTGREPGVDSLHAIGLPVCRAFAFLHENGVLHLDCKPNNVLERSRGPPAVIDLNSAVDREEGTGTLFHHDMGKPPELTPTELSDAPVGPWSDVYALGTFLCFLLTGEAIQYSEEAIDAWQAVDVLSRGADCPGGLAAVLEQATEPYPNQRFVDAGVLVDALAAYTDLPERTATLEHDGSGRQIRVRPGDDIGRWTPDNPVPAVVLPDEQRYLSATHARLTYDDGGWRLRDCSLNGTFVHDGQDWQYVLSEHGREQRVDADAPLPVAAPPESVSLVDGATIAPVYKAHADSVTVHL